ncbi:hypothetical protein [Silvibacterium acidisoli]|uniref:hypothetical protein n=1 Tax=Acidobacteriaceae bacterium ZG23-2 TaxID=2883246 RepID=UPI00406C45A2
MPVLGRRSEVENGGRAAAWLPVCANESCASGWLQMWRNRRAPVIEGGWVCSPACTEARIAGLLKRERQQQGDLPALHRHRVPLGLVLLAEGWITREDLRAALEAQRGGSTERIGAWLVNHAGLEEHRVTQALSIQWNCPVFTATSIPGAPPLPVVPRLFIDSFGCFPLRLSSVSSKLYLAFEDRIDHSLALAIERMTSLKVEAGLMSSSLFLPAQQQALKARFPRTRILEAASIEALARSLGRLVEREKPAEMRIVRLHDLYWVRFWKSHPGEEDGRPQLKNDGWEDVICSLGSFS